jgi:DNA/RNA-binding domain of Phe-tRNA-synthetase-like protein
MILAVAPEVRELGLSTAVVVATNVDNTKSSPELVAYRRAVGQRLANYWKNRSISAHPVIREYHRVHEMFGVIGEPPAPERLILYVRRNRDFTGAGPIVDCYNVVSARTLLSLGAHDHDLLGGTITLRRTTESDSFQPLGTDVVRALPEEFGYVDPHGRVICRLDVLQCEWSKVTKATTSVVVFVQGNRCLPPGTLLKGTWLLAEMLATFCGAEAELVGFFDGGNSALSDEPKPRIGIEQFRHMTLTVGQIVGAAPLAGLSLTAVTVHADAEIHALAPTRTIDATAIGSTVPVAVGLHPLKVAGRTFTAYIPLLHTGPAQRLPVLSGNIPEGSTLY